MAQQLPVSDHRREAADQRGPSSVLEFFSQQPEQIVLLLIFVCAVVVVINLYAIVKSWAGGGDVQGR
jgi:hypothetical protein